jgi:predicted amidohydrolase YtcJ
MHESQKQRLSKSSRDVLFCNANILCGAADLAKARSEAMLVRNGQIVAIGSAKSLRAGARQPEVVDLGGRFVMPSFVEPHGHIFWTGVQQMRLQLGACCSFDELIEKVVQAAQKLPPGSWIQGEGWDQNLWDNGREALPTHTKLSAAVAQHPVVLTRCDGHAVLVNAVAMSHCGINDSRQDPAGGRIVRDEVGQPTGILLETAMELVFREVPAPDAHQRREALRAGLKILAAHGITAFHECGANAEEIKILQDEYLTARFHVLIDGNDDALVEDWLQRGPKLWDHADRLQIRAIKLFADGALGSRGALLMEPYNDDPTNSGVAICPQHRIESVSVAALRRGFQVGVHAIGDLAARIVLDGFEAALRQCPHEKQKRDHRFRMEHAQLLHPRDVPRFAAMGVVASMQSCHCTSDLPWLEARLGTARAAERGYLWRALWDSGAVVINGSDTPVEPPNPFWSLHAAITRRPRDASSGEGAFVPSQCLSVEQALAAATTNAAWAGFGEHLSGELRPGMPADFIVLNQDVFARPFAELCDVLVTQKVDETWLSGQRVY